MNYAPGDGPFGEPLPTGADVLDDLLAAFTRYVAFPSPAAADAVVLWTAATHAIKSWQHAPRLIAKSPEKRCGKSRLMDVVAETCRRPLMTVNASIAAVFRSIGDEPPTLLVDEADTIFGTKKAAENNEDLRGLLNAGHQRGRTALRCVGPRQEPTEFPTFAMAMLASIGSMPETIEDRAVIIRMRRRAPGKSVAPYRTRRDQPALNDLRDRLDEWITEHLEELEKAEPVMDLEDRAADTWEPLIAVADLAGGTWPARARSAARRLVDEYDSADADSERVRLLADIKAVFSNLHNQSGYLNSNVVVSQLRDLPDAPWSDPSVDLTTRKLAMKLRDFGIKPRHKDRQKAERGYFRADFDDALMRYPTPEDEDAYDTPAPASAPVQPVRTQSDLRESADGLRGADGSTRPHPEKCPQKTAGQQGCGQVRTLADEVAS